MKFYNLKMKKYIFIEKCDSIRRKHIGYGRNVHQAFQDNAFRECVMEPSKWKDVKDYYEYYIVEE